MAYALAYSDVFLLRSQRRRPWLTSAEPPSAAADRQDLGAFDEEKYTEAPSSGIGSGWVTAEQVRVVTPLGVPPSSETDPREDWHQRTDQGVVTGGIQGVYLT